MSVLAARGPGAVLPQTRRLEVLELDLQDFAATWELQKRLLAERIAGLRPDTLILVEHPAVYTRGTSARARPGAPLPFPVHDVERGGDITYHGPGQLVGYPILHLGERGLRVGSYLRLLEDSLISCLGGLDIRAERRPGLTGVWASGLKVASIGVAVRGWTSFHGFSLNVDPDLSHFAAISPCGLDPSLMGSLSFLRPGTSMREVRALVRAGLLRTLEDPVVRG